MRAVLSPPALLALLVLLLLAGCASPGPAPATAPAPTDAAPAADTAPADAGDPVQAPADEAAKPRDRRTVEGRYSAVKPLGQPLHEDGGRTPVAVPGWSAVAVQLDSTIEVDLVLLAPGCASTADACAVRFSPPEGETDGSWPVGDMATGQWTVVVEADEDDYSFVDGVYAVHFDFEVP